MGYCTFYDCSDENKMTCPMVGGCVTARFGHLPKYRPKSYQEAEGLKQNALAFHGQPKKTTKRKK